MGDTVPCKDCGQMVSVNAKACPHCGSRKFRKRKWWETPAKIAAWIVWIGLLYIILKQLGVAKNVTAFMEGLWEGFWRGFISVFK